MRTRGVRTIASGNGTIRNGAVTVPVVVETRTLTGRLRINDEKLIDRLNAPVQGSGADRLKLALTLLWERRNQCPGAVPVLVCHDEVVVECAAGLAPSG